MLNNFLSLKNFYLHSNQYRSKSERNILQMPHHWPQNQKVRALIWFHQLVNKFLLRDDYIHLFQTMRHQKRSNNLP